MKDFFIKYIKRASNFLALGILSIIILFVTIGTLFSHFKNNFNFFLENNKILSSLKENKILFSESNIDIGNSSVNNISFESFLEAETELQKKIDNNFEALKTKIKTDPRKNISTYLQETQKIQKSFSERLNRINSKSEKISPDFLLSLANNLAQIKPPEILYEFHLKMVKSYYSIGLAFKEYMETNNETEKTMLYNFIMKKIKEIDFSSLQNFNNER